MIHKTHESHESRRRALAALAVTLACQPPEPAPRPATDVAQAPAPSADVVSVTATGEPGAYRFDVGVESPDLGCEQYADWWEVVGEDGRLIHRRVLSHSHISEQPFVRSGGPVAVQADTVVRVRAHMHPTGYGGQAFAGSVREGFHPVSLSPGFAAELAAASPRPPPCTN